MVLIKKEEKKMKFFINKIYIYSKPATKYPFFSKNLIIFKNQKNQLKASKLKKKLIPFDKISILILHKRHTTRDLKKKYPSQVVSYPSLKGYLFGHVEALHVTNTGFLRINKCSQISNECLVLTKSISHKGLYSWSAARGRFACHQYWAVSPVRNFHRSIINDSGD